MTILSINTGTSANKGDGDSLRTAFHKINLNFEYISTLTSDVSVPAPALGDIAITGATISTTGTNESIVFDPNGAGRVRFLNTPVQFDNGAGGPISNGGHILYTAGAGSVVGLGIDGTNSSLRIVGDKQVLGTLVDMGLYNGMSNAWSSKVLVDYQGNITARGNIVTYGDIITTGTFNALGGIVFPDSSVQTSAVDNLEVSYITSGTNVSGVINRVSALRFDTESGFTVIDHGAGQVEIAMNSTFKYWHVDGQSTLVAEGLDHIELVAGTGIRLTTNTTTNIKQLIIATEGIAAGLGDLLVDSTVLYANTTSFGAALSNVNIASPVANASFISIPSIEDIITPLSISSRNEVRITTSPSSNNPIVISTNGDGLGDGYVVIGTGGTTSTAGLFAFSAAAEIDFWPNREIAGLVSGVDCGTLDLYTYDNNNISIRPNGTGTTVITSNLEVRQNIIFSTNDAGSGSAATSSTYQSVASEIDVTKQVHKLSASDYYLPPGTEGQIAYFVPVTGAADTIRVWIDNLRTFSGTAVETANTSWSPFSGAPTSYAIYTDGAWTTSY